MKNTNISQCVLVYCVDGYQYLPLKPLMIDFLLYLQMMFLFQFNWYIVYHIRMINNREVFKSFDQWDDLIFSISFYCLRTKGFDVDKLEMLCSFGFLFILSSHLRLHLIMVMFHILYRVMDLCWVLRISQDNPNSQILVLQILFEYQFM